MLSVVDLSVSLGGVDILHSVSIDAQEGEIVGILGPNGAGKTTLLNAMAGRVPTRQGRVLIGGEDWTTMSTTARSRGGLWLVPEGHGLFPNLSTEENIRLVGSSLHQPTLDLVLTEFENLRHRMSIPAGSMSGGEQQMLALARAFAVRPRVLLLDEPTLGLAPVVVNKVQKAIERFAREGRATVIVEQNPIFAAEVCDRIYLLQQGRVQRELTGAEELNVASFLGI